MDRRTTPANGRVAAAHLRGQVQADRFVPGEARCVTAAVTDIRPAPGSVRERQMLLGTAVTVYEDRDGWSFLQSARDGYVGWVAMSDLGPPQAPTHHVATLATHLYAEETFKSRDLMHLPFGARLQVTGEGRKFWETPGGFVPKSHLWPLSEPFTDPATVARLHVGVPYLWGGNSTLGIDCSGLVQAALTACDIACPGDSDMQQQALGQDIPEGAPLRRGDLLFWKGHVAMLVDADTLIHANAHHMAVACEPLAHAILRIAAQGDGPVTARKRL